MSAAGMCGIGVNLFDALLRHVVFFADAFVAAYARARARERLLD